MEKKSLLLPHWCQKMGWWFLGIWAVLAASFVFYFDMHDHDPEIGINGVFLSWLLTGFPFIGLMFVCLSQESEEDEYIQYIRTRSLMWVVVIGFIKNICLSSVTYTIRLLCPIETWGTYFLYTNLISGTLILILLYLILFKGSIIIDNIRSKNNGE